MPWRLPMYLLLLMLSVLLTPLLGWASPPVLEASPPEGMLELLSGDVHAVSVGLAMLGVWLFRRFFASRIPFLAGDRGGVLLALVGASLTHLGASLAEGKPLSWQLVLSALLTAAGASGAYSWVHKLLSPRAPEAHGAPAASSKGGMLGAVLLLVLAGHALSACATSAPRRATVAESLRPPGEAVTLSAPAEATAPPVALGLLAGAVCELEACRPGPLQGAAGYLAVASLGERTTGLVLVGDVGQHRGEVEGGLGLGWAVELTDGRRPYEVHLAGGVRWGTAQEEGATAPSPAASGWLGVLLLAK